MPSPLILIPLAALAVLVVLVWAVWPWTTYPFVDPKEGSE